MASFKPHDYVKLKGGETHMRVESVGTGPDGAEMVTCLWEDMWQKTQRGNFPASTLKPVSETGRRSGRRRRRW